MIGYPVRHFACTLDYLTKELGLNKKGLRISNINYNSSRDVITFILTHVDPTFNFEKIPEGQEYPVIEEHK